MPLNPLPSQFRGRYPNSAIASYSYTDIANGSGNTNFYLLSNFDGTNEVYELVGESTITGRTKEVSVAQDAEINFDSYPFNTPRTVKGNIEFCYCAKCAIAGNKYFNCTIKKVSSGVETNISSTIATDMLGTTTTVINPLKIPVTTTQFKKGDFLRIEMVAKAGTCYIGADPKDNGDSGMTHTQSKLIVPFVINT